MLWGCDRSLDAQYSVVASENIPTPLSANRQKSFSLKLNLRAQGGCNLNLPYTTISMYVHCSVAV
jgi:hypothetical protein